MLHVARQTIPVVAANKCGAVIKHSASSGVADCCREAVDHPLLECNIDKFAFTR